MRHRMWLCALVPAILASVAVATAANWTPIGPEGGRMTAVVIDPDDPGIEFAVGEFSLFRRTARAGRWERALEFVVTSLGVASGGRVYAAGAGAMFHSTDHGATFTRTGMPVPDFAELLVVDPLDASRVYVVTAAFSSPFEVSHTLLLGTEGGASWEVIGELPSSTTALAVHPEHADRLYVAVVNAPLQVSTDGGRTWSATGDRWPCPPEPFGGGDCLIDTLLIRPEALLAGTRSHGVLRSVDDGATWQRVSDPVAIAHLGAGGDGLLYAGAATARPGTRPAPQGLVLRSPDDGRIWERLPAVLPAPVAMVAVAADGTVHAATGSPLGYPGNGLFTSAAAGASWQADQRGLYATCVTALAAAATASTTLHAALDSNTDPFVTSRDGGATWQVAAVADVDDVRAMVIDPNDAQHLVVATLFGGLRVSRDGGVTWSERSLDGRVAFDVAIDAFDGETLYIAGPEEALARSTDDGATLEIVLRGAAPITEVAVDDAGGGIYALAHDAVYASTDRGTSWEPVLTADPDDGFFRLTVAPTTPPTLYVSTRGGLRISADGGRHWRVAGRQLPAFVDHVTIDPSRALTAYAVLESGVVFRSDDGGQGWRQVGEGPPWIRALAVDPHDARILYGATCNAGVQMLVQDTASGGGGGGGGCAVGAPAMHPLPMVVYGLAVALLALGRRRNRPG